MVQLLIPSYARKVLMNSLTLRAMTITAALLASGQAVAQTGSPLASVHVNGQLQNKAGKSQGTLEGVFAIYEFAMEDGQLVANGILTGEIVKKNGKTKETLDAVPVSIPVTGMEGVHGSDEGGEATALQATCQILTLSLGPLDLNLLGLIVHLDEVNLDISADPAGGLLGDLLCGVADLLGGTLDDLLGDIGFLTDVLDFLGALDDVLDILNGIGATV
jgi:hypothetical protein